MSQRFTRLQFLLAKSRSQVSGKLKVHSESITTGTTINPLRCMESYESCSHYFEGFVPTWSSLSSKMTVLGSTQVGERLQAFDALVSPSCISHHIALPWRLRISVFPRLQKHLRARHDTSDNEVKTTAFQFFFGYQGVTFSSERLNKVSEPWPKCVDCIKGD
jgi:hypothetical protein